MQKTILCVEDDACLREDLAEELRIARYEVLVARNGREGLEAIATKSPDLILTDISMPIMNGYELLTALRRGDHAFGQIPLIFMTAFDEADTINKCPLLPEAVLQKPVDYGELLTIVHRLLS